MMDLHPSPYDTTPFLKTYAVWRRAALAAQDPAAVQERELQRLLARGRLTRFGRDHGFRSMWSVTEFQERVPLRTYEQFWADYWSEPFPRLVDVSWPGKIPYFAETSGTTTGRSKHIPVSNEMVESNSWAGSDLLVHHVSNRPESRVFGGQTFLLGGSTGLEQLAPGVQSGDLSGIQSHTLHWWLRPWSFPPHEIAVIADWEEKIERLALAVVEQDIRAITGVPSWLLVLFDRLEALHPERGAGLAGHFPNLDLLVHGGVNFAPYRKTFLERLAGGHAETREAYSASEGFIACADRGEEEGLRLNLDNGLFFEFVPVEELAAPAPTRHWIETAETGVNYALAVSSNAGLWAYLIGDTVELVSREPPRIRITGRTGHMLSAFGEHLIEAEIEQAVGGAAAAIEAEVTDFTAGAVVAETKGEQGRHVFVVEFAGAAPADEARARFAAALDRLLAETNADYKAHRIGRHGLGPPRVLAPPPGTFYGWMKRRGQLGGQHKVPRVLTDPDLLAELRALAGDA